MRYRLSAFTVIAALSVSFGVQAQTQTIEGSLSADDIVLLSEGPECVDNDAYFDEYEFDGITGDEIFIRMTSNEMTPYVALGPPQDYFPEGEYDALFISDETADSSAEVRLTLPVDGVYAIMASSVNACELGAYTMDITYTAAPVVGADDALQPFVDAGLMTAPTSPAPATSSSATQVAAPQALLPRGAATIALGETINGALLKGDRMRDGKLEDSYRFTGRGGESIVATLAATFDTYLRITSADAPETELGYDDDGGDGLNSRLLFQLPSDGDYLIHATSLSANTLGDYTLSLEASAPLSMATSPITVGRQVKGMLAEQDPETAEGKKYDAYRFSGASGESVRIVMRSVGYDAYLYLYRADEMHGTEIAYNDDGAGGTDAQIDFVLPENGDYIVFATSYLTEARGAYTIDVTK